MDSYFSNGHLVAGFSGKNYIVDTGCPLSFNYFNEKSLMLDNGREFDVNGSILCPKEVADDLSGMDISGFLGMDIIRKTGFTVDYNNKLFRFDAGSIDESDKNYLCLDFTLFLDNYILLDDVNIGGRIGKIIIDTGAPISYVSSGLLKLLEPLGERYHDYSPEYGELTGEYYMGILKIEREAGRIVNDIKTGQLPGILEKFGLFDAIVGIKDITDKSIVIDFDKMNIWIEI
ncbi:MAG: hypothetical protein K6E10_10020 [Eubacterium sp.]|nr:hypothetical protein [Eubacterium sp.]